MSIFFLFFFYFLFTVHAEEPKNSGQLPIYSSLSPQQALDEVYGKSVAVVMGIDNYTHLPKLNGAVRDATEVARVFKEELGFDEVITLQNEEITGEYLALLPYRLQSKLEEKVCMNCLDIYFEIC